MATEEEELVEKLYRLLDKKFGSRTPESMRKMFDAYDKNGDGKISTKELDALLKDADIGSMLTRSLWVAGIMGKLDENGDKHIDLAEFSKALQAKPPGPSLP
ncbi:MAG: EF-hand domain-containing protein [Myxococcales bacterium]